MTNTTIQANTQTSDSVWLKLTGWISSSQSQSQLRKRYQEELFVLETQLYKTKQFLQEKTDEWKQLDKILSKYAASLAQLKFDSSLARNKAQRLVDLLDQIYQIKNLEVKLNSIQILIKRISEAKDSSEFQVQVDFLEIFCNMLENLLYKTRSEINYWKTSYEQDYLEGKIKEIQENL